MSTNGVEHTGATIGPPEETSAVPGAVLAHAGTELGVMVEELQVAQEELHQQNVELAATQELAERERWRYLDLFESAPDAYLVTDLQAVIQEANQAAGALLGVKPLPLFLLGKPLTVFLPPGARAPFRAALVRLREALGTEELELRLRPRGGAPFDALVSVAVIRRPENLKASGFRWLLRDISERKRMEAEIRALNAELEARVTERTAQLVVANREKDTLIVREQAARATAEASERRLAFLAEASAALAGSLDYEATLDVIARLAVPALADFCCVDLIEDDRLAHFAVSHVDPEHEALLRDLHHRYTPQPDHPSMEALRTGQPVFVPTVDEALVARGAHDAEQLQARRHLGLTSFMAVPLVARGQAIGALVLGLTRSGRRYDLEDLRLAQELARRAALAIDNARLFGESQAAVRVRDTFLSSITHDLKTPLAAIKGTGQLAARRLRGPELDRAWLADALQRIDSSVDRMTGLIDQLLEIAHARAGSLPTLNRAPTDLVALLRRVADFYEKVMSHQHQLALVVPDTLVGLWDAIQLERVLDNLIANAIKYSPAGGPIEVTLCQAEAEDVEDRWAVLTICDRGIGIPAADLPHIFEHFHRAGNVVERFEGTGVGLATVLGIVEQHGGTIAVASQEGVGSTFTVRLPLMPPAATTPGHAPTAAASHTTEPPQPDILHPLPRSVWLFR